MLKTIRLDITEVKPRALIIHVVNNRNSMGAGVAKSLYTKWPLVKTQYHTRSQLLKDSSELRTLGHTHIFPVQDLDDGAIFVANMYAQDGFGYDGKRYLQYDALERCLQVIQRTLELFERTERPAQVYIPHFMGCGFAGGSWELVLELLDKYVPNGVICKLPSAD